MYDNLNYRMPTIKELGLDLLDLNVAQKIWTVIKPFVFFSCYFVFAYYNNWLLAITSVICLLFTTYVSTSHDLVHKNLGLQKNTNTILLVLIEALVLRSGHAFKICHLNHHKKFPSHEDVEGAAVYMSFYRVILEGPIYQTKLFLWAWKNAKQYEKYWLFGEAFSSIFFIIVSILFIPYSLICFYYVLFVIIGSWAYPLFTVYIPHTIKNDNALFQTRLFRGFFISRLFFNHNYHLEHHLYPMIPHQNWYKLAIRLDPYFRKHGVTAIKF